MIVWDWGWGFRMIFRRNVNVKYKHLKCTMKPDTFILNGWKQSTHGSFNSLKSCRMEKSSFWSVLLLCSFPPFVFPLSSACELSSQLGVPAGSFLHSVCCPLFWALFSLGIRNLFLFSTSSVVIVVIHCFCSVVTHYTGSSVLAHRCIVRVCCHQHAAEERAATTLFMCVMWAVRPGTLWQGVRER